MTSALTRFTPGFPLQFYKEQCKVDNHYISKISLNTTLNSNKTNTDVHLVTHDIPSVYLTRSRMYVDTVYECRGRWVLFTKFPLAFQRPAAMVWCVGLSAYLSYLSVRHTG